jgi:RNA polymerase sigma-70 factor (ECF subfamily)
MLKKDNYLHFTDNDIAQKIRAGESAFFELLIRRNNSDLYKIGRSFGFNHHDTEDMMQETYLSAYLNLSKFENRSTYKTWFIKIMINHCNKRLKKSSFKNELSNDVNNNELIPVYQHSRNTDTMVLHKELSNIIESAIENIPLDYKLVFTLRELNGLSVSETAGLMNLTETNVKVRLNRAKKMLRTQIESMYKPQDIYEFNLVYCDRIVENVMNKIRDLDT